jgi:hypothetical protein
VGGDQVFGARSSATTGNTTSFSNDFFPDCNELFDNLNMGNNTDVNVVVVTIVAASHVLPYMIFPFLFQILIEFLVLVFTQ